VLGAIFSDFFAILCARPRRNISASQSWAMNRHTPFTAALIQN
jgi:hypothetical protein